MNKTPFKEMVVQSNKLVEARYTLTVAEQRLIFAMISMIEPTDEDFKSYEIKLTDLAELWEVSPKLVYREARAVALRLLGRVLQIQQTDGRLIQIQWACLAVHAPSCLTLQFHPLLKPYLLQLKGAFTKCSLRILNQFESIYSIRIYQLLQQYRSIGTRTFEIAELKSILGIGAEQYPIFQDFKRRVLLQARKELDLKADLSFDIEGNARGKKTTAITFKIIDKSKEAAVKPAKKSKQPALQQEPTVAEPVHAARINRIPFEHDEEFALWLAKKGMTVDLLQWAEGGKNSFVCKASYNDFLREREKGGN